MQVWKATAVKTYNDGKRKITPGMRRALKK